MASYLLDSHTLLWLVVDPEKLGPRTRAALSKGEVAYASAASIWELTIKSGLGKLDLPPDFQQGLGEAGLKELSITSDHARAVTNVVLPHKDPFDALLVAQARVEGLTLVTTDEAILRAGLTGIMDARL